VRPTVTSGCDVLCANSSSAGANSTSFQFLRRESAGRFGGLPLSCGDVPLFAPDPQDKRWREQYCEAN
jgi:hypothetical protein